MPSRLTSALIAPLQNTALAKSRVRWLFRRIGGLFALKAVLMPIRICRSSTNCRPADYLLSAVMVVTTLQ